MLAHLIGRLNGLPLPDLDMGPDFTLYPSGTLALLVGVPLLAYALRGLWRAAHGTGPIWLPTVAGLLGSGPVGLVLGSSIATLLGYC